MGSGSWIRTGKNGFGVWICAGKRIRILDLHWKKMDSDSGSALEKESGFWICTEKNGSRFWICTGKNGSESRLWRILKDLLNFLNNAEFQIILFFRFIFMLKLDEPIQIWVLRVKKFFFSFWLFFLPLDPDPWIPPRKFSANSFLRYLRNQEHLQVKIKCKFRLKTLICFFCFFLRHFWTVNGRVPKFCYFKNSYKTYFIKKSKL